MGNDDLFVINSYMPSAYGKYGEEGSYPAVLDEVCEITLKYSKLGRVIWAGDLNGDFDRDKKVDRDIALIKFCETMPFSRPAKYPSDHTFAHHDGRKSQIDHILEYGPNSEVINNVEIETEDALNTSGHRAIIGTLSFKIQISESRKFKGNSVEPKKKGVKWGQVDIAKYNDIVSEKFKALDNYLDSPTDVLLNRVQDILVSSAEECCPKSRPRPLNKKGPWSPDIESKSRVSKLMFYEWKMAGRPPDSDHPKKVLMVKAKRELLRVQREAEAESRNKKHNAIMEASESDQTLFYHLIRKQRNEHAKVPEEIVFGDTGVRGTDLVNAWADYYSKLATPVDHPNFDSAYMNSCKLQRELAEYLEGQNSPNEHLPVVTEDTIRKVISSLKNKKAPDELGLMAEHLKNCPSIVYQTLACIFTKIMDDAKVPGAFKTGLVTPVHKKGKPVKVADNYRRITVTPILSKVLEKLLIPNQELALDQHQSKLQRGFTAHSSSVNAAFLITEAFAEAKDNNSPLYVAFLDASKAFDVVFHDSLLISLYQQGIRGRLWKLVSSYYTGMSSKVKWDAAMSESFTEGQGIRQGGVQSTRHFKARGNPLLDMYTSHNLGARVGCIPVSAPTCADDVTLIANSASDLQVMVNVAAGDSHRERYQFSKTKTKIMTVNSKGATGPLVSTGRWELENNPIEVVQKQDHLGITRQHDPSQLSPIVMDRITLGRRSSYAFMGAGMHGLNGLHPMAAHRIWNTYVLP
jgi:hypothetical protein